MASETANEKTTEKITINLGMVELGKIDLLVEQGIYSNRSDFIRTAIRGHLTGYENEIKEFMKPVIFDEDGESGGRIRYLWNVGVVRFLQTDLERAKARHEKLIIKSVGVISFDRGISPELFEETVESVKVYGALVASEKIKKVISKMEV